jgi:hypothetical protein
MYIHRKSAAAILLLSIFCLALETDVVSAQQRPGIRTFVNTPEGCYLTERAQTGNLYDFTKVQLQALWLASRGEQANLDVLTSRDVLPMDRIAKMMNGLREERIENICSGFVVSAFSESANNSVAASAKFFMSSYQELQDLDDEMLRIILQGVWDKDGTSSRDRLAEWKSERRDTLDRMKTAINFSLSLLVDKSRTDGEGNPDHLVLTKTQRDDLLSYLNARFPELGRGGNRGRVGDFAGQAMLIQSFLTGKYKPADAQ